MPFRLFFLAFCLPLTVLAADDKKKDELPPADPNANKLSAEEAAAGWKLLFDGKSLTGLRGMKAADPFKAGWTIDRNTLLLPKDIKQMGKVTGGDLVATVPYDNFEFRFDFRLATSAQSGILYFGRGGIAGQKPVGFEYQIIDDVHHPEGLKGGPIKQSGALMGILPRVGSAFVRMGERWNEELWNHGILIVEGNHVEHWLNDEKCLEYDLGPDFIKKASASFKGRLPAGFGTKVKSPVIILDEGEEIAFRNLKIRSLPSPGAPGAVAPATSATPLPPK
jgi:Domain of Unknown Function (DUF1080)